MQGLWSIHNGTPDSQILFAKKICTTENMCHFAGPSLTPYPLTLVEKKGIFNIWTFSHGTPHPEASWIIARESCEKFKVLTNPHGTPLLKITLVRISFGIMLSGTSSILDLSVTGDPGASQHIVPDAWRACCLQRHTALLGTMLIWIALLTPATFTRLIGLPLGSLLLLALGPGRLALAVASRFTGGAWQQCESCSHHLLAARLL